jgi:hypothetical protein
MKWNSEQMRQEKSKNRQLATGHWQLATGN